MSAAAIPSWYKELAPRELPVLRPDRYPGDKMSVSLAQLAEEDRRAITALYAELLEVQGKLSPLVAAPARLETARAIADWPHWGSLTRQARRINAGMAAYEPHLAHVCHDIRGGSLVALLGTAQMLPDSRSVDNDLARCAYYVRDHLKIMRNCISDIDESRRERDGEERPHHVDLLVEKWSRGDFAFDGQKRRLEFLCAYAGNLSQRCLEFSALDRVVYNLINNAAQHTADGGIQLALFPVDGETTRSVRIVVVNAVRPEHASAVQALAGDTPGRLFLGGLSTTGSGIGLRICGEFVAHAFGLRSVKAAVAGGYAGATLRENTFATWVHWPALN